MLSPGRATLLQHSWTTDRQPRCCLGSQGRDKGGTKPISMDRVPAITCKPVRKHARAKEKQEQKEAERSHTLAAASRVGDGEGCRKEGWVDG